MVAEVEKEEKECAKRGWPNERRWDGMETGEVIWIRIDFFFFLDHANPRR